MCRGREGPHSARPHSRPLPGLPRSRDTGLRRPRLPSQAEQEGSLPPTFTGHLPPSVPGTGPVVGDPAGPVAGREAPSYRLLRPARRNRVPREPCELISLSPLTRIPGPRRHIALSSRHFLFVPPLAELGSALASSRDPQAGSRWIRCLVLRKFSKGKARILGREPVPTGRSSCVSVPCSRLQGQGWPLRVDVGEASRSRRPARSGEALAAHTV